MMDNRILVISEVGCPPPHMGNRVRVRSLLREIRALGYEVHFAGVDMEEEERRSTQACVDRWIWDFRSDPERIGPISRWRHWRYRLVNDFRVIEPDVDEQFREYWLTEAAELQKRHRYQRVLVVYVFHSKFLEAFEDPCLRIIDTQDVFSGRRRRLSACGIKDYWFSTSPRGERRGLLRANRIIAIQEHEANFFQRLLKNSRKVFTLGHMADVAEKVRSPIKSSRIGFVGANNALNIDGLRWFLDQVWPIVRASANEPEIMVAGDVSDHVPAVPGVRVLGRVPDLYGFYNDCAVMVNPIRIGTGLKIKTFEALAHGRPVVTTACGADGLGCFVDTGLIVRETPDRFAEAVLDLLEDTAKAEAQGAAAFRRVQEVNAENFRTLAEVVK